MIRNFDEPIVNYKGGPLINMLLLWLQAKSSPTVFKFSEDSVYPVFTSGKSTCFLLTEDNYNPQLKTFTEAATLFKGHIKFGTSGVSRGFEKKLAEFIGIDREELPALVIFFPGDPNVPDRTSERYRWEGNMDMLTVEDIEKFVADYDGGKPSNKLKPYRRSEEIPMYNSAPVTVVVGNTWQGIMGFKGKDALIMYYVPGHEECD